jgi:hypothetical protein
MGEADKSLRVLLFNSSKKLIAIFASPYFAGKTLNIATANVKKACDGTSISCKSMYFRYLRDDIEIDESDFGQLTVSLYDILCRNKRKVYRDKRMSKTGIYIPTENKK